MSWLVDTDVLVDYLRGQPAARAFLEARAGEPLAVSVITVAELHAGAREPEKPALEALLSVFTQLPVDAAIARQAGAWRRAYRDSHGTGLADALIAATALSCGATLATLNTRHFPMFPTLEPACRK